MLIAVLAALLPAQATALWCYSCTDTTNCSDPYSGSIQIHCAYTLSAKRALQFVENSSNSSAPTTTVFPANGTSSSVNLKSSGVSVSCIKVVAELVTSVTWTLRGCAYSYDGSDFCDDVEKYAAEYYAQIASIDSCNTCDSSLCNPAAAAAVSQLLLLLAALFAWAA